MQEEQINLGLGVLDVCKRWLMEKDSYDLTRDEASSLIDSLELAYRTILSAVQGD